MSTTPPPPQIEPPRPGPSRSAVERSDAVELMSHGPRSSTHRRLVLDAAEFLAENLDAHFTLAQLAARAGLSPHYFQRVFRRHLGESPKQYAKRLRLERAAIRLRDRETTVTEIAFDSGYEAHESFSRAFRRAFGVSPRDYRRIARARQRTEPASLEVVELRAARIACVPHVGPYDDQTAFFALRAWAEPRGLLEDGRVLWVYRDDQEVTAPEHLRAEVAVPLPDDMPSPDDDGVHERILAAGHYAYMHHVGPASVREPYERVFRDWAPDSGWRPAPRPMLVEYDDRPTPWEAHLFVAVTRER